MLLVSSLWQRHLTTSETNLPLKQNTIYYSQMWIPRLRIIAKKVRRDRESLCLDPGLLCVREPTQGAA